MNRLRTCWWRLSRSLGFIPAAAMAIAALLATGLVELEGTVNLSLSERAPRLFGAGPDGARGMLTAIASSMLQVAGVVFSVTLVALSLASSQYSPRVLRTFTSDRPTQVVLGVFVGVYVYCLVVLRTVRGGDDSEFIPSIAVLVGLLLALIGVASLIYFIHHLSESVQASSIVARIAAPTLHAVDRVFSEDDEQTRAAAEVDDEPGSISEWCAVPAVQTGYIVHVDTQDLVSAARGLGRVIRMQATIGDFIIKGQALASVSGAGAPDHVAQSKINSCYSVDSQRTIEQDPAFGLQQLVDIARKALSPALNDASTAILCIDRITEILRKAACRFAPPSQLGDDGELRLMTRPARFETLVQGVFAGLAGDAREEPSVTMRLLWSIEHIAAATCHAQRRATLAQQTLYIAAQAANTRLLASERETVLAAAHRLHSNLSRCAGRGSRTRPTTSAPSTSIG